MQEKFKEIILVPNDFTEVCANATEYAAQAAKYLDYKLMILHVLKSKASDEDKQKAQDKLDGIVEKVGSEHNIKADSIIGYGSIFSQIQKHAEKISAALIVLGTHGKKGMQYLIGSNALRVITKAPVPSIVVQNKPFEPLKNIVFPITDFTEARQKIKWAVHMAKTFDAKIHLFRQKQSDPGLNSKIETITDQTREAFDKTDISYTLEQAEKKSHLPRQITAYAEQIDADMIMIMTEPDIFSPDFSLGPWDEKIMFNEKEIPVMCINPVDLGEVHYAYLSMF